MAAEDLYLDRPVPTRWVDSAPMTTNSQTIVVLGDQLNRNIASLEYANPKECQILMVEADDEFEAGLWHVQRMHLFLSARQHFAEELRAEGFEVDYRVSNSLASAIIEHKAEFNPESVTAMEPLNWDDHQALKDADVELVRNNQFYCHYEEFAEWAGGLKSFKMEDFYRWQRKRFNIFMEGNGPVGGKWNYDHDNREKPPKDGRSWPTITKFEQDDIDTEVMERLKPGWGDDPHGLWPINREQALLRLDEFIETGLKPFGPHEDAMLEEEWKLAHSTLSSSINLGLLHPTEVIELAEAAYHSGEAPINSVEGFIRQVLGWREYVWGVYWLWMPEYRDLNTLEATRELPKLFTGEATTHMACVGKIVRDINKNAYAHHIERLMVLSNFAMTSGVNPQEFTDWMTYAFVDSAEWVMLPNVIGMSLHADGGMMATKPYASGGSYVHKMSNFCKGCKYDPKKRTGEDACPFTTLYWNFLQRHQERFKSNHRMFQQYAGMKRLKDLDEVGERAEQVLQLLDKGEL